MDKTIKVNRNGLNHTALLQHSFSVGLSRSTNLKLYKTCYKSVKNFC